MKIREIRAFLMPWEGAPERAFGIHCIVAEYLAVYSARFIERVLDKLMLPCSWTIVDYADYLFDSYADGTKWYLYKETREKMYEKMYNDTIEILLDEC